MGIIVSKDQNLFGSGLVGTADTVLAFYQLCPWNGPHNSLIESLERISTLCRRKIILFLPYSYISAGPLFIFFKDIFINAMAHLGLFVDRWENASLRHVMNHVFSLALVSRHRSESNPGLPGILHLFYHHNGALDLPWTKSLTRNLRG